MATAITVLLFLICAGFLVASFHLHITNRAHYLQITSLLASTISIMQKNRMDLLEQRNKNQLLEDTLQSGTTAVEFVHRAITSTTFVAIDRFSTSEKFRASAQQVRRAHDDTSRSFYRSVRATNKTLHALANVIMSNKSAKRRKRRP